MFPAISRNRKELYSVLGGLNEAQYAQSKMARVTNEPDCNSTHNIHTSIPVPAALPQLLAYMLANPQSDRTCTL
jgi:hypothetical protein